MSEKDNQAAAAPAREGAQGETRAQVEHSERGRGGERRRGGGRRRHGGGQGQPSQSERHRAEPSFNMGELRELTELFTAHGLTDFEFENAEIRVRLSRNPAPTVAASAPPPVGHHTVMPTAHMPQQQAPPAAAPSPSTSAASQAEEPAEDLHIITSPIVGTFYRSPSPSADAFVKVGSRVEPETVVCIIEAMKLMNEILAETTGTVKKIYVENGQPVEYGQPLFGVKT